MTGTLCESSESIQCTLKARCLFLPLPTPLADFKILPCYIRSGLNSELPRSLINSPQVQFLGESMRLFEEWGQGSELNLPLFLKLKVLFSNICCFPCYCIACVCFVLSLFYLSLELEAMNSCKCNKKNTLHLRSPVI